MEILLRGEEFILCYEKCLWRKKDDSLIISDLHLGKINHFRKAGIGLPMSAALSDFEKLEKVLKKYQPSKVIFLGDLFHSVYNQSVEMLKVLLQKYNQIEFILVKGNHDIMDNKVYEDLSIKNVDYLADDNFILSHDKLEYDTQHYNIFGHIHPGVLLKGKGKQSSRLPCFYFSENEAVLPAFGKFTGLHLLKVREGDRVYVMVDNQVIGI